ncbi:hypothetical protein [Caenimonas koreensis]|uniref:hypothetical protein n=1 Tax=Caenimonas koreensis TaxID=367474 RepID=UPI003783D914
MPWINPPPVRYTDAPQRPVPPPEAAVVARFARDLTLAKASDRYQVAKMQMRDNLRASDPAWRPGAEDVFLERQAASIVIDGMERDPEYGQSRALLVKLREAMLAPLIPISQDATVDGGIMHALSAERSRRSGAVLQHPLYLEMEQQLAANQTSGFATAGLVAIHQVSLIVIRLMQCERQSEAEINAMRAMETVARARIGDIAEQSQSQPSAQPSDGVGASPSRQSGLRHAFDQILAAALTHPGMQQVKANLSRVHPEWSPAEVAESAEWCERFHLLDEFKKKVDNGRIDPDVFADLEGSVLLQINWTTAGSASNQFAQTCQLSRNFEQRYQRAREELLQLAPATRSFLSAQPTVTRAEAAAAVVDSVVLDLCTQMRREAQGDAVRVAATARFMLTIEVKYPHLVNRLRAPLPEDPRP